VPLTRRQAHGAPCRTGLRGTAQRGLSLVELMVGITVGLIVVAAASVMVSGQLSENRRLVAEAQVQQDLRASVDIITREIRRAGSSDTAEEFVWGGSPGTGDASLNTLAAAMAPASGSSSTVTFSYRWKTAPEARGFRLNSTNGSIEALQGASWQELTDRNTIEVTEFTVTRLPDTTAMVQCQQACPGGGGETDCWPRVTVRSLALTVVAQSRALPEVVRRHESVIRLRNDLVPSFAGGTALCPT
jgi:prepilin-type N-terminal cleavage/methylation domain-containing protein